MKERQPHQDQRYIEALLNNDEHLIREIYEQHSQAILPFEGDNGLSILLSKAFLPAGDDKIRDGTIVSQIGRR